ncbi:MAG: hydrogenase nickel incorporation protein HypB [Bacilli bacterium]|nr:hydrogenase nickel incorporation protein HypB [Bacilli bacterium]
MKEVPIYEIKEDISLRYAPIADDIRKKMKEEHTYLLNVMSSPGSGKTTLLISLINKLKNDYKIAVIETDIDGREDAQRIYDNTGVKTIQIHTGGACHLTSQMSTDALKILDGDHFDLIIIENIGNLVCPAEFDVGAIKNLVLLSLPEGDDKPLKYPLMFEVAHVVAITKVDTQPIFDFKIEEAIKNIKYRNPNVDIFVTSAKNDIGVDDLANYIKNEVEGFIR